MYKYINSAIKGEPVGGSLLVLVLGEIESTEEGSARRGYRLRCGDSLGRGWALIDPAWRCDRGGFVWVVGTGGAVPPARPNSMSSRPGCIPILAPPPGIVPSNDCVDPGVVVVPDCINAGCSIVGA
jgi:hypothetical protein